MQNIVLASLWTTKVAKPLLNLIVSFSTWSLLSVCTKKCTTTMIRHFLRLLLLGLLQSASTFLLVMRYDHHDDGTVCGSCTFLCSHRNHHFTRLQSALKTKSFLFPFTQPFISLAQPPSLLQRPSDEAITWTVKSTANGHQFSSNQNRFVLVGAIGIKPTSSTCNRFSWSSCAPSLPLRPTTPSRAF